MSIGNQVGIDYTDMNTKCDDRKKCKKYYGKVFKTLRIVADNSQEVSLYSIWRSLPYSERNKIAGIVLFFTETRRECSSCKFSFEISHLGILIKDEITREAREKGLSFEDFGAGTFAIIKKFLISIRIIPKPEKKLSYFCSRCALLRKKDKLTFEDSLIWRAISQDCKDCYISWDSLHPPKHSCLPHYVDAEVCYADPSGSGSVES